ncbi:hypothetical protein ACQ5SO_00780 [Rhodovulum sp. DZ06]|uniref:hypothetical protein n=1 Tax=Rhodovulum sp. DZ06 TaxID=3425126 RepID=UPI003D3371AE
MCFERDIYAFFVKFAKFESALKSQGYCRELPRGNAAPHWRRFKTQISEVDFPRGSASFELLAAKPKQQMFVDAKVPPVFEEFDPDGTTADKVVDTVKLVRNNLFHGGKHDGGEWDDPDRVLLLARLGAAVLDELAQAGGLQLEG